MKFNNTYFKLPGKFYQRHLPEDFPSSKLIVLNQELVEELGLELPQDKDLIAQLFSGQKLFEGSDPAALAYAGFQFGHPVPELGDGRALLLGEINGRDIQLKGSGRTAFSRQGDGRSALGPVLREYILSEAMFKLNVPTTRALCAVETGEEVIRQFGPEPGGIFTRVADSHIRVGTFQYFAFQGDLDSLKTLFSYTLERHYPELLKLESMEEKCLELLRAFTIKQAELVAKWSSLGFIHGVMNTDNFSLAGITIDYGPCAFMDEFKFHKVFSSIDRQGRYSFFNQVPIAKWNILRLADCLLPLINSDQEIAIEKVESLLEKVFPIFEKKRLESFSLKLGLQDYRDSDEEIVMSFLEYLEENELDFTLSFRNLPKLYTGDLDSYVKSSKLDNFINLWKARKPNVEDLDSINPLYIPRNHQVERAIDLAYEGDFSLFHRLLKVYKSPFCYQDGEDDLISAPKREERVQKTYCGT